MTAFAGRLHRAGPFSRPPAPWRPASRLVVMGALLAASLAAGCTTQRPERPSAVSDDLLTESRASYTELVERHCGAGLGIEKRVTERKGNTLSTGRTCELAANFAVQDPFFNNAAAFVSPKEQDRVVCDYRRSLIAMHARVCRSSEATCVATVDAVAPALSAAELCGGKAGVGGGAEGNASR